MWRWSLPTPNCRWKQTVDKDLILNFCDRHAPACYWWKLTQLMFCLSDFLAEATLRKHRGGRSYIAFKFSFTGNRFVLEAGIVVTKYEVQWNSYLSVTLLFLFRRWSYVCFLFARTLWWNYSLFSRVYRFYYYLLTKWVTSYPHNHG